MCVNVGAGLGGCACGCRVGGVGVFRHSASKGYKTTDGISVLSGA